MGWEKAPAVLGFVGITLHFLGLLFSARVSAQATSQHQRQVLPGCDQVYRLSLHNSMSLQGALPGFSSKKSQILVVQYLTLKIK